MAAAKSPVIIHLVVLTNVDGKDIVVLLLAVIVKESAVQIIVPSAYFVYSPLTLLPRSIIAPVGTPPDCDTVPRMLPVVYVFTQGVQVDTLSNHLV